MTPNAFFLNNEYKSKFKSNKHQLTKFDTNHPFGTVHTNQTAGNCLNANLGNAIFYYPS